LSHLALQLTSTIVSNFPNSAKMVKEIVFPNVLGLLKSKVLQGYALDVCTEKKKIKLLIFLKLN